jgi:Ca-activated chloride channel family protein
VVVFSTGVRPFALDLRPASESSEARQWLDTLFAEGGTNIDEALRVALDQNDRERPVVILFLTDGQPTEGITDMDSILGNVAARTADNVRVFTFGVGDDVNTFLLDELSLRHHGASAYVRPGENIEASVSGLYGKVSAPVLTDLALEFEGMNVSDIYPPLDQMPDLFAGSQLMVVGRYRQGKADATLRLSGQFEGETQTFVYDDLTFRSNAGGDVLIPRLWATRRIGDLMNAIRLRGEDPELVDSIVRLSIRYGIITPYTSFIITEADVFTEQGLEQAVAVMQPTATALAATASGSSAVNAAQASGGMYSSNLAPTAAADAQLLPMTVTPLPSPTMLPLVGTPPSTFAMQMTATAAPFGTVTPSGTPVGVANAGRPADGSGPARSVRTVGDRAFVWRDGVWIDTTYNPDEMRPRRIVFLSDAYFDLLDLDERVAEFYALGDHVIFVLDGQAYEVVPE